MSSSMALRRSPKPGAFTAQVFRVPRSLLTTRVVRASPSMSSAMMRSGLLARATCSKSGSMSFITLIFFSWISTRASSSTASMRSGSVTKYGLRYPRSNCMPSTTSSTVSADFDSSTVMTPSLPTFSIASAIRLPIVLSLFDAIVATCAISFLSLVDFEMLLRSFTTASTAASMPRFNPIGLAPAVTFFRPSRKIAWASTVAVVVPAPATSEVLEATSRTICAPMFSYLSFSSISLATVTPSLVIVGLPNFLSMTTLRPFGPSVAFTAAAMTVTPLSSALLASSSNLSCFGMDHDPPLVENGEDVFLAHDEEFLVVDLDLGARILPEQDLVAALHVERHLLAVVVDLAGADGDDLALLRLFLGRVRDDDPAPLDLFFLQTLDQDPIVQRTNLHLPAPPVWLLDMR